eukprot:15688-Heterococcus_DN1.PRE.1
MEPQPNTGASEQCIKCKNSCIKTVSAELLNAAAAYTPVPCTYVYLKCRVWNYERFHKHIKSSVLWACSSTSTQTAQVTMSTRKVVETCRTLRLQLVQRKGSTSIWLEIVTSDNYYLTV